MNKNLKRDKKKKGFTLIELIIVIAILTILAAIAIPNLTSVRDNAKVKADAASREVIRRATLTLIADDQISTGTAKTAIISWSGTDKSYAYTEGTATHWGTATTTGTGDSATTAYQEEKDFESATTEVNKPQEANKSKFSISIDTSGKVTVTTTN